MIRAPLGILALAACAHGQTLPPEVARPTETTRCTTARECAVSCGLGAMRREVLRRLTEVSKERIEGCLFGQDCPVVEDCRDGCHWSHHPGCVRGRCVALRADGEIDPECTEGRLSKRP